MRINATVSEWQVGVHALAQEKGWYDGRSAAPREILANLMLVVSEIAEAAEEIRAGNVQDIYKDVTGKPCGLPVELADAVIRILDTATWLGIDVEAAMMTKHMYNKTRPYKHGGKKA